MELKYGKKKLRLYDRSITRTLPFDGPAEDSYNAATGELFHDDGSVAFRPEDLGVFYKNGWCAFCEDSAAILDPAGKKLFRLPDDDQTETGTTYDEQGLPKQDLPYYTVEAGSDLSFDIGPHIFRVRCKDAIVITSSETDRLGWAN